VQPSEETGLSERILTEAARLFVTRGYAGISMREIAEAVGVSKAGLYYHFRDKEDLFIAILTANLERIGGIVQAARQEGRTTREQIALLMRGIFAQTPEQRAIIRLASQEMVHLGQPAQAKFNTSYQNKFVGQIEQLLREGIARGELRPMNAALATWILLGMMYPFFYPAHRGERAVDGETIELMLTTFFEGVQAPNLKHQISNTKSAG